MSSKATDKKSKSTKIDTQKADDIKEKSYITKQVDTSIAILDSPENDVVLESLLFLSKYADIQLNNLNYLQQHGMMVKLLNLFNRNICILRLALRLLSTLVTIDDVLFEMDQDKYDEKIIEIADMYISHNDSYVREFCVGILAKLATSCRVTCLIFKIDLFNPILITVKITQNLALLQSTLELLYVLLNAPAALGVLPDIQNFDISIILTHLDNPNKEISHTVFEIIRKLTYYGLEVFQNMFKQEKLMEKMFDVILDPEKIEFHQKALNIIKNCMNCEETESYFITSLEFLKFCQWVKSCDQDYLLACVDIFERLSKIPSIKQTLFDLSVEDSILYFLRSMDKKVLNKTCKAISNMTTHKFCCERMLNPTVIKSLIEILYRKDEEDPGNEIALKTIFDFSRRNVRTLDVLCYVEAHDILLQYFKSGSNILSEESLLRVLEILYKWAIHPVYQVYLLSDKFFEELLNTFVNGSDRIATFTCEILTSFVNCKEFRNVFLFMNGPRIFIDALKTNDPKKFKNILMFVHSNLINNDVMMAFIQNNLVTTLKRLPEALKYQAPLIDKILTLIYSIHLPLKFFESNRLDITDKFNNKFYLMNGPWKGNLPFLEILEALKMSTIYTIYVVDYTYEVRRTTEEDSLLSSSTSSKTFSMLSMMSWESSTSIHSPFILKYGQLSPDHFLPKYIFHISKFLIGGVTMEDKVKILGEYVDSLLCGPRKEYTLMQKIHTFKLHIESLKEKLGTNMIPIGFLRIGFHCERALLFKALGDKICIPSSLIKGKNKLYWNEVAIFCPKDESLKLYVVDLMTNIGTLLRVGSKEANEYCKMHT